ncbi:MAG: thioredoxin family protein [Candidatus Marinimicrobia bacterium]|nr:thioredoxin family protein [Candidatus Neomarinimicrobiota bacterium]MCF7828722.1 thioredoxin family protein [Candidatus Neomarinimicrobiota bacterium]MCF7880463.1 thioredoxin family protein [Candidatus Neomarinimicrobiota bacterium]
MLHIKVVGTGCPNCQKLEALCKEIVEENEMGAQIDKVTDMNRFAELGVFMTPGLVVNDEVVSSGKIPTKSTLKNWLQERVN